MTDIKAKPASLERVQDASISYQYIAPPGHTLEQCMNPEYWANNVRECGFTRVTGRNAWNKIEIIAEDGSWEADLRILSAKDGLVHTRLLRQWPLPEIKTEKKPEIPKGFKVEYVEANGWRALDTFGEPIAQKLPTEIKAIEAAIAHAAKARKG